MKSARLLPPALFLLALIVRCIGLQWGLPNQTHWYSYHPDEYQMFTAVVNLISRGDFNPQFFNYPSLYIYLAYFAHGAMGVLGLSHPFPQNQSQLWMLMRDVLLSARVVTAILGAATVPLVFLIARQIGGWKTGVLAASLLTFAPGHVQHSHFATVDVPATFFVTLCLWLSTRALDDQQNAKRQGAQLFGAAFVAGLAAATKYNAALILIAPLAAWFFLRKQTAKEKTVSGVLPLSMLALAALGFFIGCPYSVFDFPAFWGDGQNTGISYELLVHPRIGHGDVFLQTGNSWIYHLFFNAPFLLTAPLLIAALFGMMSTRAQKFPAQRTLISMLLIWCGFYFFALGFSQVRFMRYLLPLAPALCVFAACGVLWLRARHFKILASAVLVLIAAWGARDVLYPFVVTDPRDAASTFLNSSASTPATVGMVEPPWFFSPPLSPLDSPPFRRLSSSQLSQLSGGKYQFAFTDLDAQKLKTQKPQWFVLSEFEWRDKARLNDAAWQSFEPALQAEYSIAARFQNTPPLALPGRAFVPHDFLYTDPEVRVYRRH